MLVALTACGGRSDLSSPPPRSCKVDALATHACATFAFDAPPTQIDLALDLNDGSTLELFDRGDHVDAILGTTVSSLSVASSTIAVTASRDAFDLCGPIARSGDLFASLCNTPFTVFRLYDGTYARVTEREIATPSAATSIVGGAPSSWLVSWDGFAAVLGPDTQPIVATVSEDASFVSTSCGFVGIQSSFANSYPSGPTNFAVDFSAPGGTLAAFDSVDYSYAPLVALVRWPYDGASVAVMIGSSGFDPPPTSNRFDVVSPDKTTTTLPIVVDGWGPLLATPIGLVSIELDASSAALAVGVIEPDGSRTDPFLIPSNATSLAYEAKAVWSNDELVLVWRAAKDTTSTTWGATVRCAE